MSFASDIKSELLRIENKKVCCSRSELCGILCYSGKVSGPPGGRKLKIATENAASARRCFALLKSCAGIVGEIFTGNSRSGGNTYGITVENSEDVNALLWGLGLISREGHVRYRILPEIIESECCRRAFLRGAFLGGGSIANPEKEYHLEFSTGRIMLTEDMVKLFAQFDLVARTVRRKASHVIYFKGSGEIGDVLSIIGAHNSYMELMNICIMKETRNNVNRKVNCETANMDKTIEAAYAQIRAIKALQKSGKFDLLPEHLQETGRARLAAPDASMTELGKMMGVSKSGVNHRMTRLLELSEEEKNE